MKIWVTVFSLRLTSTVLDIFTALRDDCKDVNIVSREEYRARPPINFRNVLRPVNDIFISHTETLCCATQKVCQRRVQYLQHIDMEYEGLWDIRYNFLVGGDGNIFEGRGWIHMGFHAGHYNPYSYSIAFIGNFSKDDPTDAMLNATLNLIKCGKKNGYIAPHANIHGLRDVTCTDSPGDKLYSVIRCWPNFTGGRLPHYYCNQAHSFRTILNVLKKSFVTILTHFRIFQNALKKSLVTILTHTHIPYSPERS